MTLDEKRATAEKLRAYRKDKQISQRKIGAEIGINSAYISHIEKENFDQVPVGSGKYSSIPDGIFKRINQYLATENSHWDTDNFVSITNVLTEAKAYKEQRIIDGSKGTGKTYTATEFKKENPNETYLITCSSDMNQKEFILDLARKVGINSIGTRRQVRLAICQKLKMDSFPVIIIDESENMRDGSFGAIKDLYDEVKDYCGIVLIGANNFLETLRKKAEKNKGCFPQLVSRFSASPAILSDMTFKDVKAVAKTFGIEDKSILQYLFDTCSDFRELDRSIKRMIKDAQLKAA